MADPYRQFKRRSLSLKVGNSTDESFFPTVQKPGDIDHERFANLSRELFCIVRTDGYFKYVHPTFEQTLGFPSSQLLSRSSFELIHPDDRERTAAALQQLIDGQKVINFENRYVCRDGSFRWLQWRAAPPAQDGLIYAVTRDMTDHKQAVEALKSSQAKYQDFYDHAPDMFVSVEAATGKIIQCNRTLETALGYTNNELVGRHISFVYHADCQQDREQVFRTFVETGEVREAELQLKRKDGSKIEVSLNITAVRDEQGHVLYSRSIWRNITRRKRVEQELRWARDELEVRVNERTAHLEAAIARLGAEITERKRMEESTRQSQQFLQSVLDNLSAHVALLDETGAILAVNGAWKHFADTNGFVGADYGVGMNYLQYCKPVVGDDQSKIAVISASLREVLANRRNEFFMDYACHSAEMKRWFQMRVKRFEGQGSVRVLVTHENITEVMLAKEALKESERRFGILADTAPLMIWMSGLDKGCTYINKGWLDFTGKSLEESYGDGWAGGVHPDDIAHCLETYHQAFDARQGFLMEYRLKRCDGEYRWILDSGVPLFTPHGSFRGYIGTCIDMTDRKLAELGLQNKEAHISQLLQTIPDAFLLVRGDGTITHVNDQVERTFGYHPDELYGQSVERLVPEALRVAHVAHRSHYMANACVRPMAPGKSLTGQRKDGSSVPVEIALSPFPTEEGTLVMCIIRDVSDRMRAEQEARVQRHELAHIMRVATISELAGTLAHELKQPLAAILSNAQALMRFLRGGQADMDEVRETLQDIIADDKRASGVLNGLRQFLKKDRDQFESLDINKTIQEILQFLHSDLVIKHLGIETELAPDLPAVLGDRVQMQQVILNLVLNAGEAMKGQGSDRGRVVIKTDYDGEGGIRVAVRDNGPGIEKENLDWIFQPFFTTKEEGLGIGLAITRSIVNAHGGRLWVENNYDQGTTFSFTLPVAGKGTPA